MLVCRAVCYGGSWGVPVPARYTLHCSRAELGTAWQPQCIGRWAVAQLEQVSSLLSPLPGSSWIVAPGGQVACPPAHGTHRFCSAHPGTHLLGARHPAPHPSLQPHILSPVPSRPLHIIIPYPPVACSSYRSSSTPLTTNSFNTGSVDNSPGARPGTVHTARVLPAPVHLSRPRREVTAHHTAKQRSITATQQVRQR